jgi:hypothetical protein
VLQAQAKPTPTTPKAPDPYIIQVPAGVPTTKAELDALYMKRSEVSNQLQAAAARRQSLQEQLKSADPSARAGIEERLKVLDDRIVRLEKEIDRTGDLITRAPSGLMTRQEINPAEFANRMSKEVVPIVGILSVFVFAPFAIAMSRLIWKRASQPPRVAIADQATQQRLESLQQSVDTIAIEVERISEGQRFVTKLLSERGGDGRALGAGVAESIGAPMKSAVSSER